MAGIAIICRVKATQCGLESGLPLLDQGSRRLDLQLDRQQLAKMLRHLHILARWNRGLNLTAIDSPADMIRRHVLDSLSVLPHVRGRVCLDIGSGGGFPGVPLAIAEPERDWLLLDSRGKRVEFLGYVIGELNLSNVRVIAGRLEDYRPLHKIDTLVARAFASVERLLKLSRHLHTAGTRLLAMKGRYPLDEVRQLAENWQLKMQVEPLSVPQLDAARHVIIIDM